MFRKIQMLSLFCNLFGNIELILVIPRLKKIFLCIGFNYKIIIIEFRVRILIFFFGLSVQKKIKGATF